MKKTALLSLTLILALYMAFPSASAIAWSWPWDEKPNEDIKLVLKVARGEFSPDVHDTIILQGSKYIKKSE